MTETEWYNLVKNSEKTAMLGHGKLRSVISSVESTLLKFLSRNVDYIPHRFEEDSLQTIRWSGNGRRVQLEYRRSV